MDKTTLGSTNIRDVRTIAVESWLMQLQRKDGEVLANSSKAKIRNVMSLTKSELTFTTRVAVPTHGIAGRHHWIVSQRTTGLEME